MKMELSVFYPYKFNVFAKSELLEEIIALLFLRGALPQSCSSLDIFRRKPAETFNYTPTKSRSADKAQRVTSTGFSSATTSCSSADISSRRSSSVL